MNNFFIITNTKKDPEFEATHKITEYLRSLGCKCSSSPYQFAQNNDGVYKYTDDRVVPKDVEVLLVIGGDGTLIHAAKDLIELNIPIIGINFGTLGYLAEVEINSIKEALDAIINNRFHIENRMLIEAEVYRENILIYKDFALNDVVISRTGTLNVIDFNLCVDGEFLNRYHADGVIVSTPTGSTGYNLSAGGPVVHPTAEIILITPICAHTLNSRSIVFSADIEIEIEVLKNNKDIFIRKIVAFDADNEFLLKPGDKVKIKRANEFVKIIKINSTSFIEALGKKMR